MCPTSHDTAFVGEAGIAADAGILAVSLEESAAQDIHSSISHISARDTDVSTKVIKHAFEQAQEFHHDWYQTIPAGTGPKRNPSCTADILNILQDAKEAYEKKKSSRSKARSFLSSSWMTIATRIKQFEQVIDTLVSSNPEYAALAWGAIKFLFLVTAKHEELFAEIATCFTEIGATLPEMEFISAQLFPTPQIRLTLAQINAHIIEFCIRATKWYQVAGRNSVKQYIKSITSPWLLEYGDITSKIDGLRHRLYRQAGVANWSETRDIHLEVRDIHRDVTDLAVQMKEIRGLLDTEGETQFRTESLVLATNERIEMRCLTSTPKTILPPPPMCSASDLIQTHLSTIPYDHRTSFESVISMRDRRRERLECVPPDIWLSVELQEWISIPQLSFLRLQSSMAKSQESRDFALDMIELIQDAEVPVLWFLYSPSDSSERSDPTRITFSDVLKSLVKQCLEIHSSSSLSVALSADEFASSTSLRDWQHLLAKILATIPRVALVIDAYVDMEDECMECIEDFWSELKSHQSQLVAKLLLLTYSRLDQVGVDDENDEDVAMKTLVLKSSPRKARSRAAGPRGRSYKATFHALGPQKLRPYVRRFAGKDEVEVEEA